MPGVDETDGTQPLVEPRLIRLLKERPRLIDKGLRKEFLAELEKKAAKRRDPGRLAEQSVNKMFNTLRESTNEPVKKRAREAAQGLNDGPLEKL